MSYRYTSISAAPVGSANGYKTSVNMRASAYALDATAPTFGARHVTCTRSVVVAGDTPGTIVLVGKDLNGQTITETLVPGAHGVLVTGTKFFASLTSATGVGWIISGVGDEDTIVIGWDAINAVATGSGVFHAIMVNTTAAGIITVADANGTIAVLPSNVAVGFYGPYDVAFAGYLRVEPAAASQITVMHTGSKPGTWSA